MANKKKKKAEIKKRIADKKGVSKKKRSNTTKNSNLKVNTSNKKNVSKKNTGKKSARKKTVKVSKKQTTSRINTEKNKKNKFNIKSLSDKALKNAFSIIFNKYVIIGFVIVVLLLSSLYVVKRVKRANASNDYFEKISLNEYMNIYSTNKDLEYIYLADSSCMNCDKYEDNLLKLKSDLNIKLKKLEINSLSPSDLKKIEDSSLFFEDGITSPTLISIQNGIVTGKINGIKEFSALKKFVNDTKKITNYNFNIISVDKFASLLTSKDKVIIYIGDSRDNKCSEYSKILNNVSNKLNLKINYLNTDDINTEEDWNKLKKSDNIFNKNWFVPVTIIVKNGEIKDYKMEIMNENDIEKFLSQ